MIDRRVSRIVNLKVKGPEDFVDRVGAILERRLAAVPTGSKRWNDDDDGVHRFYVVTEGALDLMEGRIDLSEGFER